MQAQNRKCNLQGDGQNIYRGTWLHTFIYKGNAMAKYWLILNGIKFNCHTGIEKACVGQSIIITAMMGDSDCRIN